MTKSFPNYDNLLGGKNDVLTFILYDGHKTPISLTLAKWAKGQRHTIYSSTTQQPCYPAVR